MLVTWFACLKVLIPSWYLPIFPLIFQCLGCPRPALLLYFWIKIPMLQQNCKRELCPHRQDRLGVWVHPENHLPFPVLQNKRQEAQNLLCFIQDPQTYDKLPDTIREGWDVCICSRSCFLEFLGLMLHLLDDQTGRYPVDTWLGHGDLTITLHPTTGFSSLCSTRLVHFNFSFWTWLNHSWYILKLLPIGFCH